MSGRSSRFATIRLSYFVLSNHIIDIYHSYLALAALATMNEPGLKPLDAALCISIQQKEKLEKLRKAALGRTGEQSKHGFSFSMWDVDPDFRGKRAAEGRNTSHLRSGNEVR